MKGCPSGPSISGFVAKDCRRAGQVDAPLARGHAGGEQDLEARGLEVGLHACGEEPAGIRVAQVDVRPDWAGEKLLGVGLGPRQPAEAGGDHRESVDARVHFADVLGPQFRQGVVVDHAGPVVNGDGLVPAVPGDHLHRTRQYQARDVGATCRIADVVQTADVRLDQFPDEVGLVRGRGQVDDGVLALGGSLDGFAVHQIGHQHGLDAGRGAPVEAGDLMAGPAECGTHGGTDTTCGTGHQDRFGNGHCVPPLVLRPY